MGYVHTKFEEPVSNSSCYILPTVIQVKTFFKIPVTLNIDLENK